MLTNSYLFCRNFQFCVSYAKGWMLFATEGALAGPYYGAI
jgi:hypothetical protein